MNPFWLGVCEGMAGASHPRAWGITVGIGIGVLLGVIIGGTP